MSFPFITNLIIGLLNGYNKNDYGLPNSIKYTSMSVASVIVGFKMIEPKMPPNFILLNFLIAAPLMIGSTFCLGTQMGKGIKYLDEKDKEDKEDKEKSGSKISILK